MLRRLAFFAGLFVILGLGLAVAARLLLDPRHYVDELQHQAAARLGLAVSIGGGAELSVFPWLGLILEDVSIAAPEGFGPEPLITAKQAELRVGLLALVLRRQLTFDRIRLHRPELRLRHLPDGRFSWDAALSRAGGTAPEADNAWPIHLHGIEVTDGAVRWIDDTAGQSLEFTEIGLSVSAGARFFMALSGKLADRVRNLEAQVYLKGNGRYVSDPFDFVFQDASFALETEPDTSGLPWDIRFSGRLDASLSSRDVVIKESKLRLGPLRTRLLLRGSHLFTPESTISGRLFLAGFSAKARRSIEAAELRKLLSTLQGQADLRFTAQETRLENIVLAADGMELKGEAAYSFEGRGCVSGTFAVPKLDVEKLFPADESVEQALPDWMLQWPEDWPEMRLSLAIAELSGWSAMARSTNLRFENAASALRMDLEAKELLGGSASATCGLRNKRLECALTSKQTQLDALAGWIPDLASATGTADITLEAAAPVASLKDAPARLEASLSATLSQPGCTYAPQQARSAAATGSASKARSSPARSGQPDDSSFVRAQRGSVALTLKPAAGGKGTGGKSELLYDTTGALKLEKLSISSPSSPERAKETADLTLSLKGKASVNADQRGLRVLDATRLELGYLGTHLTAAPLKIQLKSSALFDPGQGSLRLDNASLSGAGLTLTGNLLVDGLGGSAKYHASGTIKAETPTLRETLAQLGLEPPSTRVDTRLGASSASARLSLKSGLLECSDLRARIDDTNISGTLTVQLPEKTGQQPGFHFTLTADALDADSYRPPPAPAPAKPEDWDTGLLHGLRLNGSLSVSRLTWLSMRLNAVRAELRASGGHIALSSIYGEGYGGRINGAVQLDVPKPQATPALTLSLTADKVQLEPLLHDLGGGDDIGGTSQFSATLAGTGRNGQALLSTLNGQAWLSAKNGFYVFSNSEAVSRATLPGDMSSPLNSTSPQSGPQRTPYSEAKASFKVENGVVRNDDFFVQGTLVQAKGSGHANLPAATIDYTILVQLVGTPTLPFRIFGALNAPEVTMRDANLFTDTAGRLGGSVFDIVKGIITLPVKALESLGLEER